MTPFALYAIGNALVDTEYAVSDEKLTAMGVSKGHMTLVDGAERAALLAQLADQEARQTGGGSAGNTVVAFAQFGGSAFYSCRVADDQLGRFYAADLAQNGVLSNLAQPSKGLSSGAETGCCLVLVTPDAERSMSTYLGTTAELDASALDLDAIGDAGVYYMEGYLAASPSGLDAAVKGRTQAVAKGVPLALTLSDVSMINFCKPGLDAMLGTGVDYLFCNEEEAQVWCGVTEQALVNAALAPLAKTVCLTRGAKGTLVLQGGQVHDVPGFPVKALDANGAGDMFAGAFLYGLSEGMTAPQAASLANKAASVVVAQRGNRLTTEGVRALLSDWRALSAT
ncbi:MAG: adenosine kinase [Burkholderiaceae bacterium]